MSRKRAVPGAERNSSSCAPAPSGRGADPQAVSAYIGLGSNLDDPVAQVHAGFAALARLPGTRLIARSSLYRSEPVGYREQPDFVNAVALLDTTLAPRELLDALLGIERSRGRVREFVNAPRTLDLDVLLYDDLACREPGLIIPHPRLHERSFALVPLAEISPDCVVPGRGPVADLLRTIDAAGVARLAAAA
jgi:2-amino-4-hydroxy-6-hydroxymethyldihydropteridine diphosphokinase